MRRGFAFILLVSALGSWTPSAFGQYPYPYPAQPQYGPMPGQYMQPQQYGPMPAQYMQPQPYSPMPAQYGPNPMMPPPGYYPQPMPMMQPQQQPPRVYVFGPLTDTAVVPVDPAPARPGLLKILPGTAKPASGATSAKANLTQVQLTLPPAASKENSGIVRTQLAPEACGSDCGDGCCAPTPMYDFIPKEPKLAGHGHFIGDVGAYYLVPFVNPRTAFSRTDPTGATTTGEFQRQADYGPFVSFGYISHNTWGVRADYWYLHGSANQTASNADPASTLATPTIGGFQIVSPSLTLQNGIGTDQFNFSQRLDMNVADIEVLKEWHLLDTTMLFGFGARYASIQQSYSATRTNPGGFDPTGVNSVTFDREDLSSITRYTGWGPTVSFEILQPLGCSNFSFYSNFRAAFLWGTQSFTQNNRVQERSTFFGVTTFTDNQNANAQFSTRQVEVGEVEVGLQYGRRFGPCYLFARTGIVLQRWWNVGNPTGAGGNLEFLGGTTKIGISY